MYFLSKIYITDFIKNGNYFKRRCLDFYDVCFCLSSTILTYGPKIEKR